MDQSTKSLPPPAKPPVFAVGNKYFSVRYGSPAPRVFRGRWHDVASPENRLRRKQASKEIVKRALTPPCQRLSWRWRNFTPKPSRFSYMSMA
ncbi:hypothetical protein CDL12_04667 [Handroanthus impetiginosus]|uniref:Uncharacterized protein n=1 Tax=Handroanthus impetiginosus TaxID=429701 RepID=A0A2G9HYP4_9LAMI|nr:hypothetical protein CDL12_04667 [Handroanthus impetiginosus]